MTGWAEVGDLEIVGSVAPEVVVVLGSLPMLSGLPMKQRCADSGALQTTADIRYAMVPQGVQATYGV